MRRFTLKEICAMPTLRSGHFDNLVFESENKRVWISRMTVEDGMEYNNQVTVEKLVDTGWEIKDQYEAK